MTDDGTAATRLILCEPQDVVASWIRDGLEALGLETVLVTSEELCAAERWDHRVASSGTSFEVRLADGRVLDDRRIRGVLNRLVGIPLTYLARAEETEREYVEQEWRALLTSALAGLSHRGVPVVEPPHPYAVSGRWRSPVEWSILASRAGLPVQSWAWSDGLPAAQVLPQPTTSVLVIGRRVIAGGPIGRPVRDSCGRLARLASRIMLEVQFGTGEAGPITFAGVAVMPDPRSKGEAALEALTAVLGR